MDQALFAASGFGVNVALARWLGADDYGAFVAAYAVFLLVSGVHNALVIEPTIVYSSSRSGPDRVAYTRTAVRLHMMVSILVGAPLLGIGIVYVLNVISWNHGNATGWTFVALGVSTPAILLFWFARRVCHAHERTTLAALASAVNLAVMLALLFSLWLSGVVTPGFGVLAMAVAALVSGGLALRSLTRVPAEVPRGEPWQAMLRRHWIYGRWVIATSVVGWIPSNAVFVVLPMFAGLSAAGVLRAATTVNMPFAQVVTGFALILLPAMVRVRGTSEFRGLLARASSAFGLAGVLYSALVLMLGAWAIELVFGPDFAPPPGLLLFVGMLPGLSALRGLVSNGFRAIERPRLEFYVSVVAALGVLCTLPLIAYAGVVGAAAGGAIAGVAALVYGAMLLRRTPAFVAGSPQ